MSVEAVTEITNKALYLIIKVSMPILLVSLIIGLVVSIFQTVTSIQEQTLTFLSDNHDYGALDAQSDY